MNRCPSCNSRKNQVYDSRPHDGTIKRRRRCLSCDERWSTFEVSEATYAAIVDLDALLGEAASALAVATAAIEHARSEGSLLRHDYDLETNGHRKLRRRSSADRSAVPASLNP